MVGKATPRGRAVPPKTRHKVTEMDPAGFNELQMIDRIGKGLMDVVSHDRDEKVMMSRILKKGGMFYVSDIFLPNGCKALGMPQSTIIEIKKKALFDTVSQQKEKYRELGGVEGAIKRYILAIGSFEEYAKKESPQVLNGRVSVGFEVISVADLSEEITKVKTKKNRNETERIKKPTRLRVR